MDKITANITPTENNGSHQFPSYSTYPPPPKGSHLLKIIIIILLFGGVFTGAYYLGMKGYKVSIQNTQNQILPSPPADTAAGDSFLPTKPVVKITDAPQLQVTERPMVTVQPIAACTRAANAQSNLFNSDTMKVCFLYGKTGGAAMGNVVVKAVEQGTKVYVHDANMAPSSGQSLEKFDKVPGDTLEQAITKKFLQGIPADKCNVKIQANGNLPANLVKATIAYPVPANGDLPNWEYGQECPEHYKQSNGIAYFLMDKNHPDRFFYFSIGQYGIPSASNGEQPMWQDTIQIY